MFIDEFLLDFPPTERRVEEICFGIISTFQSNCYVFVYEACFYLHLIINF